MTVFDTFDPSEEYYQSERTIRRPSVGLVTKVFEHDGNESEFSNHEVNVQLISNQEELKRLPVHVNRMGEVRVPAKGDFVEVNYLSGKTQSAYVCGFAYTNDQRAPLGRAGHWKNRFGDQSPYLFLESEPSDQQGVDKDFTSGSLSNPPELLRMSIKDDGLSTPSLQIKLDTSGSEPVAAISSDEDEDGTSDMEIGIDQNTNTAYMQVDPDDDGTSELTIELDQSGGEISITSEGQPIKIGDVNGTFKQSARKGDSVEVTDTNGNTLTGTITSGSSTVDIS